MTTQPQGMPEGIYFNMQTAEGHDRYHDDPALSHSGMTKVLISWPDYWINSCLNPERKKLKKTEAMEFGEQSGMLLTQPRIFHQTYNTHGRSHGSAKGVWLSSSQWQRLNDSVDAITDMQLGKEHFMDGYAEVAVFWKDPGSGVMLRAKFDYLRTFGCIDVKRIKEVNNITIGRAVKEYGLDIQAFLYIEAIKAARTMLKNMGNIGRQKLAQEQNVDLQWLEAFMADTDLLFRFLFQRSTPPYIWEFRDPEEEVLVEGGHAVFAAIRRYKKGLERYGLKKPPMGYHALKTISSYHVPRRDYEYDEE